MIDDGATRIQYLDPPTPGEHRRRETNVAVYSATGKGERKREKEKERERERDRTRKSESVLWACPVRVPFTHFHKAGSSTEEEEGGALVSSRHIPDHRKQTRIENYTNTTILFEVSSN